MNDTDLLKVLDHLESMEEKLLSWGIPDVQASQSEIEELIQTTLNSNIDIDEIISQLQSKGWIRTVLRRDGTLAYRSRAAETVRLLSRLRQWFPGKEWVEAPTLTADYRYRSQARLLPKSDCSPKQVEDELKSYLRPRAKGKEALHALLGGESLRGFQLRTAKTLLLEGSRNQFDSSLVVTAGTGAGKTKAFYFPVLLDLLTGRQRKDPHTVVIAIYPRRELLKDQFQTLANRTKEKEVESIAQSNRGRPISIGAYYSDTPKYAKQVEWKWLEHKDANGRICPYLRCWSETCENENFVWRDSDRQERKERLHCPKCGKVIGSKNIVLTRDRMLKEPPDILCLTMEMLNNILRHPEQSKVVGVDSEHKPRFVLLDEVHTYSGLSGSQNGMVLKRWRSAIRRKSPRNVVQFVGLSATIRNPAHFLSLLTGVERTHVVHIQPQDSEMQEVSRHYQIVLRGDPISATATLSTTIQALMLIRRMLDTESSGSKSFGTKVFAFTDTLDLHRRLTEDLKNAERNRLAELRGQYLEESREARQKRDLEGQLWSMSEEIGHDLSTSLKVDDVSSLSPGMVPGTEVVIATASLEVGFDDPAVGAVLQHKAPHGWAQYLQRIGRAGRNIHMRPWTIVVLSDYGRDHLAYQNYQQFFEPELDGSALPINNRYVLKMQATFCLLDYLARILERNQIKEDPLLILKDVAKSPHVSSQQTRVLKEALTKLMTDRSEQKSLKDFVLHGLRLRDNEDLVQTLLWTLPRGLLIEVIPAMWRILEGGASPAEKSSPLGAYIPPNLFSNLNLPEVEIAYNNESRKPMPIRQALTDFSPGRVTRRFGGHWCAPADWRNSNSLTSGVLPLSYTDVVPAEYAESLGVFQYHDGHEKHKVEVIRPRRIKPLKKPYWVHDNSNSQPEWKSQIVSRHLPAWQEVPRSARLSVVVPRFAFFLHTDNRPVEVRRFTLQSNATIRVSRNRTEKHVSFQYNHPENPDRKIGLGFRLEVDAIAIDYHWAEEVKSQWYDFNTPAGHARRIVKV